jgi:hypothetical protein
MKSKQISKKKLKTKKSQNFSTALKVLILKMTNKKAEKHTEKEGK